MSQSPQAGRYRLAVTRTAARALSEGLPQSVAAAVLEFLQGDLLVAARRVGHELRRELAGTWSARRGSYRVLYEISEDSVVGGSTAPGASPEMGTVLVVDIDHRSDVYRRR